MSGEFCRTANFDAQHVLASNGALCQFILINHGRDNHHCMSLPVGLGLEEGDVGMPIVYGFIISSGGAHSIYIVYIILYRYLYIIYNII